MACIKTYNKFDVFIYIIISSLIFGVMGGALMPVRIVGILLSPFLFFRINHCWFYVRKYVYVFLFFLFFCLISLLWTIDIEQASKELFYYPTHFLLFLEILVFPHFAKDPLKSISTSWVLGVGLTLIVALWEIYTGNHLSQSVFDAEDAVMNVGGQYMARPFASVTFGNFNGYVSYLCLAMPFIFYFILCNQKRALQIVVSAIILFITVAVMLVNASRGGLLTILIMAAVFLFMTKRSIYKTILVVAIIIFVVFFVLPQTETIFFAMSIKAQGDGLSSDNSRLEIWKNCLHIITDYVFVGSGIGSAIAALKNVDSSSTPLPHNMLLELLMQYGILFFVVFVVYLFKLMVRGIRSKDKNIKILLLMAIIAFPAYSIIDSRYLLRPDVFIAFACFTVYAYIGRINPPKVYNHNI